MALNLTEALKLTIEKERKQKIYFYSSRGEYGFLSNFYPSKIFIDNKLYHHVEGYYQSIKFSGVDESLSNYLASEISAVKCKYASNTNNLTEERKEQWNSTLKLSMMKRAVLVKFASDTNLTNLLLETDTAELIEDSPVDYYWGCGKDETGENMLGKVLMEVRELLKFL